MPALAPILRLTASSSSLGETLKVQHDKQAAENTASDPACSWHVHKQDCRWSEHSAPHVMPHWMRSDLSTASAPCAQKSSVLSLCWPSVIPDARPYLTQAAGQRAAFLWSRAALPAEVDSSDPRGVCPHVWSHLWRHCWCVLLPFWAENSIKHAVQHYWSVMCLAAFGRATSCEMLHDGTASCCCRQEPMQVAILRQHYARPHCTLYLVVCSDM